MKKKLMMSAVLMMSVFALSACSAEGVSDMMQEQMEDYIEQEVANRLEEELAKASATKQEQEDVARSEELTVEIATETVVETEAVAKTEVVAETETVVETQVVVETEATVEEGDKPSVTMPTELSDDIYAFQVSLNGTILQFPMWYSDFEALGYQYTGDATQTLKANQYTVSEIWEYDGAKIATKFANLSMNTKPYSECIITGICFDDFYLDDVEWEIILPKGIQYGVSTKDDIIAAYGTPSNVYEGSMYYKMTYEYDIYNDVSLYVFNESGVLEEIEIENMVELEGADNSVNEEVPELVKQYKAPSEVGEDLYSFYAEIEGNLYSFPCPVSELLANGFTIQRSNTAEAIAAGGTGWVELRYDNQSIRFIARNFADYATIPENCFALSFETNSEYEPTFDITVPCGIKLGDSEAVLKEKTASFNCDVSENTNNTFYTVHHPDKSILDCFEFRLKDGIIVGIEFENDNKPEY